MARSMEAEHREILRQVLAPEHRAHAKLGLQEMRASLAGRSQTPSEVLLRESREER